MKFCVHFAPTIHCTGPLAPANFSGVVYTCVHFQKIAQISSLCDFHYISEVIPSLMSFWLLMTLVLRIWFMRIFAGPKKPHKPRTWCSMYLIFFRFSYNIMLMPLGFNSVLFCNEAHWDTKLRYFDSKVLLQPP